MNVEGVLLGVLLFGAGVFLLIQKKELADSLFSFYNRPRREGRFAWLDKRIAEPGQTVCLFLATAFGFVVGGIGLTVIVLNWS